MNNTVSGLFYNASKKFKLDKSLNNYKESDAVCRVCGCSDVPEGYAISNKSLFGKGFVDFNKFKRNDRNEVCIPCLSMIRNGLASWIITKGNAEEMGTKGVLWYPRILNPPEPPFVMAWQNRVSRKHVLLGSAIGESRDYFPLNTQDGSVWIDRILTLEFLKISKRIMSESKSPNKIPVRCFIESIEQGKPFEITVKRKSKKAQYSVFFTKEEIDNLVELGFNRVSVMYKELLIKLT